MQNNELLVDKYRPTKFTDMCLDTILLKQFQSWIDNNSLQHCCLYGRQGIGKTTTAMILGNSIGSNLLYVNCAQSNSVNDIRAQVTDFSMAMSLDERPKIVILDEADSLSRTTGSGASAQDALRGLIEDTQKDTRFILTCNYINKIIEPITSRCTPIEIKFVQADVLKKCIEILNAECVTYSKDVINDFYKDVIIGTFPDIRMTLNVLSMWIDGNQLVKKDITSSGQREAFLAELLQMIKSDVTKAREYWINSEEIFGTYEELGGMMFNAIEDIKTRMIIAKHLAEMPHVLDKEINFCSCVYEITQ